MSNYPAPEKLSNEDLGPILAKLQLLLENLPNQLPVNIGQDSCYASLIGFQPNEELVEMTGSEVGALNVHLERMFGYATRSVGDGILPILERGPLICAIHNILRDYCAKFPSDNILKKWVIDIAKAAEKVYNTYQVPVSHSSCIEASFVMLRIFPNGKSIKQSSMAADSKIVIFSCFTLYYK